GSDQLSPVEFHQSANKIDILIGGKLFTTYHFEASVAKPYFQPLRSAQGTIVTRDFPNGHTVPAEHQKDKNLEPHQRPCTSATAMWMASIFGVRPHFRNGAT